MRVGQIRILAWGFALVVLTTLVLLSSSSRQANERTTLATRTASAEEQQAPQLFHSDGPAEMLAEVPARPQERSTDRPRPVRDSQLREANVIWEPGASSSESEPELSLPTPYALNDPRGETPVAPPQVPLDVMLDEPRREEVPIKPRVSQEIPSEPEFASPPPFPLPIISSSNPAMQPVNAAAREHVLKGFALGERAAIYAARTEFIEALRTIAQALDAQAGLQPKDPQSCSQALVRGLQALTEADDFAPEGRRLDGDLDLGAIIAAHRTPVGKQHKPASQLAAMQAYFNFAREELQRAAAANSIASQALTGLGKSYTVPTEKNPGRLASAKAMVFHQAAVGADPRNHLAANELGVLLAKHGQWEPAKQAFLQSLRVQADASAWQNLANIHQQLGESELAALALSERQILIGRSPSDSPTTIDGTPTVQWVDPKAFAGPPEDVQPQPRPATRTAKKTTPSKPAKTTNSKSWLPWK
jgi:tetratricopeptide (TPR) repeat protein